MEGIEIQNHGLLVATLQVGFFYRKFALSIDGQTFTVYGLSWNL